MNLGFSIRHQSVSVSLGFDFSLVLLVDHQFVVCFGGYQIAGNEIYSVFEFLTRLNVTSLNCLGPITYPWFAYSSEREKRTEN